MIGTTDLVDVWIALEYDVDWQAKALADNALGAAVNTWLKDSLRALFQAGRKPRALFIRQPDRTDGPAIRLLMGVMDDRGPRLRTYTLDNYAALNDIDLVSDLAHRPSDNQPCEPHYLVCTNAQRDQCCGRYGLPLYLALRDQLGDRVWQSTHLGGHRFAPNVLSLPDMALYGRVEAGAVSRFVEYCEAGGTPGRWLRGRSAYPYHVQAAEALLGDTRQRASLRQQRLLGPEAWEVVFQVAEDEHCIRLRLGAPIEVQASCADPNTKLVRPFEAFEAGPDTKLTE